MPPLARIPAESSRQNTQLQHARLAPARRSATARRRACARRARAPPPAGSPASGSSSQARHRAEQPTAAARSANAPATIAVYSVRVRSRPSRTASVRLPARRSVSRSRTLLTTRIALASRPDRHGAHERLPRQLLHLHEVGARDRDDAEEQEHEQLAEPLVAVRARAAGVEHAGEDRRRADREQLPAGDRDQVDAAQRPPGRTSRTSRAAPGCGGTRPPAVTRTGPRRSSVSAPRRASE